VLARHCIRVLATAYVFMGAYPTYSCIYISPLALLLFCNQVYFHYVPMRQVLSFNRVEVPGGQLGYIAPFGAISYTGPHLMFMPLGSFLGGYTDINVTPRYGVSQTLINWDVPVQIMEEYMPAHMSHSGAKRHIRYTPKLQH